MNRRREEVEAERGLDRGLTEMHGGQEQPRNDIKQNEN